MCLDICRGFTDTVVSCSANEGILHLPFLHHKVEKSPYVGFIELKA